MVGVVRKWEVSDLSLYPRSMAGLHIQYLEGVLSRFFPARERGDQGGRPSSLDFSEQRYTGAYLFGR